MSTGIDIKQRRMAIAAAALLIGGTTYLFLNFGVAPLLIVGGPGIAAYVLWYVTYLHEPIDPAVLLPPFLITVAGFECHAIEEYLGHYGPAVGRLFGFAWTDQAFIIIVVALCGALSLVSVGLYFRRRMAGFVAILFLATRIAELALFIFPLLRPAVQPDVAAPVSQTIAGVLVDHMPNHYLATVGSYYFPGMLTVALPIVPAVYALRQVWLNRWTPSRQRIT